MQSPKCIRECADHLQIARCKDILEYHSGRLLSLSSLIHLVGNEVRFKIVFLLSKENELCPCDLSDILEMKIPAVSQHLRKLRDGGLITSRRERQTIFYSLEEENRPILNQLFENLNSESVTV